MRNIVGRDWKVVDGALVAILAGRTYRMTWTRGAYVVDLDGREVARGATKGELYKELRRAIEAVQ